MQLSGGLVLYVDEANDAYCGESVFGAPTRIAWTVERSGGALPIFVTLEAAGLNPGVTVLDHPVSVEVVTAGAVGGLWQTLCLLDVGTNEPVPGGPTTNRVEGVVECSGAILGSTASQGVLSVDQLDFVTAVSRGQ